MANFNSVPTISVPRTKFDMSFGRKQSGSVGTLYPCYIQEIYPGDVFECDASIVTRVSSAYIRPPMDNLYLDMYFFFVPSRLCFSGWAEIFGENRQSAWAQQNPVAAPTWYYNAGLDGDVVEGSVADYLGLPLTDISGGKYLPDGINILPFRAFALIYDEWFRDQNIIAPMNIQKGSFVPLNEYLNNNDWSSNNYTGMLPKVARFHDYFSSALPSAQKGAPVSIPVTGMAKLSAKGPDYNIPVVTNGHVDFYPHDMPTGSKRAIFSAGSTAGGDLGALYRGDGDSSTAASYPSGGWDTNLYADLSASGVLGTVNDLRMAFQLQKILERSARSGSRYTEYLLSAFSVQSPDARLQRPEYLGGKRMPLSVQQVAQTSATDSDGTLAGLGAFSLSNGKAGYTKGFVEHGFVIGVMCVRQTHTYQQGIEKFWSRSSRFSYYDPALQSIGEQPVYKDELYGLHSQASEPINSTPFGYQECWADLRYRPSQVCGEMRSDAANSLDIWHFGDDYANAPTLNKQWLEESPDFVDRTLAVPSSSLDQFIFDIYFKQYGTRCLPAFGVPSLLDHH